MNVISDIVHKDNVSITKFYAKNQTNVSSHYEESKELNSIEVIEKSMPVTLKEKTIKVDKKKKKSRNKKIAEKSE